MKNKGKRAKKAASTRINTANHSESDLTIACFHCVIPVYLVFVLLCIAPEVKRLQIMDEIVNVGLTLMILTWFSLLYFVKGYKFILKVVLKTSYVSMLGIGIPVMTYYKYKYGVFNYNALKMVTFCATYISISSCFFACSYFDRY